jgi:hypothetical protein
MNFNEVQYYNLYIKVFFEISKKTREKEIDGVKEREIERERKVKLFFLGN